MTTTSAQLTPASLDLVTTPTGRQDLTATTTCSATVPVTPAMPTDNAFTQEIHALPNHSATTSATKPMTTVWLQLELPVMTTCSALRWTFVKEESAEDSPEIHAEAIQCATLLATKLQTAAPVHQESPATMDSDALSSTVAMD